MKVDWINPDGTHKCFRCGEPVRGTGEGGNDFACSACGAKWRGPGQPIPTHVDLQSPLGKKLRSMWKPEGWCVEPGCKGKPTGVRGGLMACAKHARGPQEPPR